MPPLIYCNLKHRWADATAADVFVYTLVERAQVRAAELVARAPALDGAPPASPRAAPLRAAWRRAAAREAWLCRTVFARGSGSAHLAYAARALARAGETTPSTFERAARAYADEIARFGAASTPVGLAVAASASCDLLFVTLTSAGSAVARAAGSIDVMVS